jgi:hypothetical protein
MLGPAVFAISTFLVEKLASGGDVELIVLQFCL